MAKEVDMKVRVEIMEMTGGGDKLWCRWKKDDDWSQWSRCTSVTFSKEGIWVNGFKRQSVEFELGPESP